MTNILTIIKPWGLLFSDEILKSLDEHGERLDTKLITGVPRDVVANHYATNRHLPWWEIMVEDIAGKDIQLALYNGEQPKFNDLKLSIRERFARNVAPHPNYKRNVLHVSEPTEVEHELTVWRPYLKTLGSNL